ncbi:conserved repeat protein [Galbibacter orientalis DSM 19592]|uniref:Conserved repeat protein n=1 Tax=Galbibacter orientalis DSM 19592 TaxID=926559 RepID=I3C1E5_9FLAO|nr:T9SS C-terminal target domain-containing protein [Galbibacter orientalis]EIJ37438.1 conserved repeat protein [Galbibacter orientalis DSM 19592]
MQTPYSLYYLRIYLGMLVVIASFFEKAYAQSENEQITISPGESVQLNAFSEGTTYYVWLRNNEVIENATNSVYSVIKEGIYKAIAYNDYNCGSVLSNSIEVRYSKTSEKFTALHFCEKAKPTIMELDIGVNDLIWHSTKERNVSLPATTLLEDGKMYYASSLSSEVSYAVEVFMDACIDIAIQKEVDKVKVPYETIVNFTISVFNTTNIPAINVIVKEELPSGYIYQEHQSSAGIYKVAEGIWSIPKLASKAQENLKIKVKVANKGDYQNQVSLVYSEPEDFEIQNNVSTASVNPLGIIVHDIFTPNNDGMNDTFVIDSIDNYPENVLKIYNRYGTLVYHKKTYDNSWDGFINVNGMLNKSERLPPGVYFYNLDLGSDTEPITGWIFIGY